MLGNAAAQPRGQCTLGHRHGMLLASASSDRTVKVWHPGSGVVLHTLTGHTGRVGAMVFSADGRLLVPALDGKTIVLWATDAYAQA